MVYGVEGYGNRPDFADEPPIADWFWLVLGYNEPDQKGQSDIPPQVAAQAWKEMQDQYPDKVWVSPATAGIHTNWLDEFMSECEKLNCRVDYMSTHSYRGKLFEFSRQNFKFPKLTTPYSPNFYIPKLTSPNSIIHIV